MSKILIEHNGIPGIINHNLYEIGKVTYVVVYKEGDFNYIRKDFENVSDAINFESENDTRLVFAQLKGLRRTRDKGEQERFVIRNIEFLNTGFPIRDIVKIEHDDFALIINYGFEQFSIRKHKSYKVPSSYHIIYKRGKEIEKENKIEFEFYNSYFEFVPRYEDIFLETIFFLDVIKKNNDVSNETDIEAYFFQAKTRVEEKGKFSIKKDDMQRPKTSSLEEYVTLDNLIGLEKVKLEIQELKALANYRQKRIELGLPVTPNTLHMVFTGNPGTGKTTVARLLGQIYFDIGILTKNIVVEASRQDLVGKFIGHTAPKTQKVFEQALGGILFIDEAYALLQTGHDFGKEAVETLLKLMEDNREKIVVIIAGYPKEMEELISSNPGLKSRFSKTLHFDDYSKEELLQICLKMVSEYNNTLTEGAKYKIEYLIDLNYDKGAFNSNARIIRNIFEAMTQKQSYRLSKIEKPTQEEMMTFIDKDIPDKIE
ncbi:MAG: AAA family ATPase [Ignavibacteriales bacterium]|nr:AAA family ATPase [Ignavibacteriales bacterium]